MIPLLNVGDAALARFWSKVSLPNDDGCMLWSGGIDHKGYARFWVYRDMVIASRLSLFIADGGPYDGSQHAAHSCRNRHCVAPAHLRWATPVENQADRLRDGTDIRGEVHGIAKLTEDQVIEMRRLSARGISQRQLAPMFGISQAHVSKIVTEKLWRHVQAPDLINGSES